MYNAADYNKKKDRSPIFTRAIYPLGNQLVPYYGAVRVYVTDWL